MVERFRHPLIIALGVFLAYYALGQAAIHLTIMPEGIVTFWPPNAVVVAALILTPARQWALYLIAGLLAEGVADYGFYSNWQIAGFGAVNACEALLTASLARWVLLRGKPFAGLTIQLVFGLSLIFLFISSPLAALGGSGVYYLNDSSISYWAFWRLWWFGDAIGLLVLTPFLLVWTGESLSQELGKDRHGLEVLALTLTVGVGASVLFFAPTDWPSWTATPSLLLPLLAWASLRFGLHGATATTVFIAFLAAAGTTQGRGPFATAADEVSTVLALQEYLLAAAILALALSASVRQLNWALAALKEDRELLEIRVAERTQELESARMLAEQRARTDDLTGLINRAAFFGFLKSIHDQARRYGRTYSTIMIDIDHFKSINDTYGHAAGDTALKETANIIAATVRDADVAGRIGGEEFAVCLPETPGVEAFKLAERLCQRINQTAMMADGVALSLTASFGVSQHDPSDKTFDSVMSRADQALYRAKKAGRNRVISYEDLLATSA